MPPALILDAREFGGYKVPLWPLHLAILSAGAGDSWAVALLTSHTWGCPSLRPKCGGPAVVVLSGCFVYFGYTVTLLGYHANKGYTLSTPFIANNDELKSFFRA